MTFPVDTYDIQSSLLNSEYRRRWKNTASILPQMLVRTYVRRRTVGFSVPDQDQKPGSYCSNGRQCYSLDKSLSTGQCNWFSYCHPLDSDLSGFDRLPWPVNSAIQLLSNNWGQKSVWDRSHVNSEYRLIIL